MRDSRRAHVEAVLKRVNTARSANTGNVEQRDLGEVQVRQGEARTASGGVKGEAPKDGMVNIGLEEDIADHNVWA